MEQFGKKVAIKDEAGNVVEHREVTGLTYDFGDNLDDAVAKHSAEVVYAYFVANGRVGRQAYAGGLLSKVNEDGSFTYTEDEVRSLVTQSELSLRQPGKTDDQKTLELWSKLDPDTQKRLLKEMKG